jgi:hypothetical protein
VTQARRSTARVRATRGNLTTARGSHAYRGPGLGPSHPRAAAEVFACVQRYRRAEHSKIAWRRCWCDIPGPLLDSRKPSPPRVKCGHETKRASIAAFQ